MTLNALTDQDWVWVDRAVAHVAEPPAGWRQAQKFAGHVSELATTRLMLAIERGTVLRHTTTGWKAPAGSPAVPGLAATVAEMVRTGLLRDYRDPQTAERHLIPARTHLDAGGRTSRCLFAGEDLGAFRARLVKSLDITDCLDCEALAYPSNRI